MAFAMQGGCRFTAQLGSMRIAEEIDAMESIAIRPIPYLVTTRLLASVVAIIPLYAACLAISYLTTQMVVQISSGGSTGSYLHYFSLMLAGKDILYSLSKAVIFVWIASTIQCYYGYLRQRRPRGGGCRRRTRHAGQHHRRDHGEHAAHHGAVGSRRRRKVRWLGRWKCPIPLSRTGGAHRTGSCSAAVWPWCWSRRCSPWVC